MSNPTETVPKAQGGDSTAIELPASTKARSSKTATPCAPSSEISSLHTTQPPPSEPTSSDATEPAGPATCTNNNMSLHLASFRPTPHQIISCIAPHVFDERNRRRRYAKQKQTAGDSKGQRGCGRGLNRSSPLRGAVIIAWDEHSIYLEQPDSPAVPVSKKAIEEQDSGAESSDDLEKSRSKPTKAKRLLNKSNWIRFRVDRQILKNLRIKFAASLSRSSSRTPSPQL